MGEKDRVAHPALCRRAFRQIERAGASLETWFLPDATHAFDEDDTAASWFRYDEAAYAEARTRLTCFLGRVFPAWPRRTAIFRLPQAWPPL